MKAAVRRSLERLMKRRIRHRDGSKISPNEARGLAKIAELMHDANADRDAALNASIARHPAGKQRAPEPVTVYGDVTCLRCEENPALPHRVWCAVCAEYVDQMDATEETPR